MIVRILENNKVVKINTNGVSDETFLTKNPTGGFIKVDKLPYSRFQKWKYENGEIVIDIEEEAKLKKQEKIKVLNNYTINFIKKVLKEYDYENEGEVALYASNENSIWYKEAKALQEYIEKVYIKMYEFKNDIENDKNIDISYPKFIYEG